MTALQIGGRTMMETAVKERLVGAAVLVALVVIVVPALLSGPPEPAAEPPARDGATRSVEIAIAPPRNAAGADEEPLAEAPAAEPVPRNAIEQSAAAGGGAAAQEPAPAATAATAKAPDNAAPAAAIPAAAASGGGAWAVQVAAFSRSDAAQRMVADLRRRGYAAFAMEFRADGRVLHRVRVGPETGRDRADALAVRLQAEGFKAAVVAHP